jgi:hypothetical protein
MFAATAVATAVVAGYSVANAAATDMHCANGYCWWGYNYVGQTVNTYVHGTWNYWYDQSIDKTSGGTIAHGFDPYAGCYHLIYGAGSWYGYPSSLGCGGYLQPYTTWISGNTSYLTFDDIT